MQHDRQRVRRACQTCRRKKLKCDGDDPCERCRTQCIRCQYAAWQPLRGDDEPTAFDQLAARMDSMEKMFLQFRDELGAMVSAAGANMRLRLEGQDGTLIEAGSPSPQQEDVAYKSRQVHYADGFGELSPDFNGSLRYVGLGSTASVVDRCDGLRRHIDESLLRKGYQPCETFLTSPRSVESEPVLHSVMVRARGALKADEQLVVRLVNAYFEQIAFLFPVVTAQEVSFIQEQMTARNGDDSSFGLRTLGKFATFFALLAAATPLLPAQNEETGKDQESCRENPTLYYGLAVEIAEIASRAQPPGDLLEVVVSKALLGLYLAGIGSQAEAWIVTGEAIRRGQDIGLHRSPKRLKLPPHETSKRQHVWWCLFVLEVQLSAALGRPMSIDDSECDVELPSPASAVDLINEETGFVSMVQLHQVLKRVLKTINSTQIRLSLRDTDKHALLSSMIQDHHSALETWAKDQVPLEVRMATSGPLATVRAVNLSFFYVSILLLYRIFLPHPHRTSALERSTTQMTCAKNALYCIQSTDFMLRHNVAGTFLICHAQHVFVSALVLLQCIRSSQEICTVEKWYEGVETATKQLQALEAKYEGARKCRAIVKEYLELTKLMQGGVYTKGVCNFSHPEHPGHAPMASKLCAKQQLEPHANLDRPSQTGQRAASKKRKLTASSASTEPPRWVGPALDTPSRMLPVVDLTSNTTDMLRTCNRSYEVPLPSPPRGPQSPQRPANVCGAGASDLSHGSWEDALNTFSPDFTDLSLLDPLLNPHLSWLDFSQTLS